MGDGIGILSNSDMITVKGCVIFRYLSFPVDFVIVGVKGQTCIIKIAYLIINVQKCYSAIARNRLPIFIS